MDNLNPIKNPPPYPIHLSTLKKQVVYSFDIVTKATFDVIHHAKLMKRILVANLP